MARHILLVEDDLRIQEFAQEVLTDNQFRVSACATAAEAKRLFALEKPDLVILDIGLPDANGVDLSRDLGLGSGCDIPFLFLTAQGDLQTRIQCFAAGAYDYVQKPFAIEELIARVNVHLGLKRSKDELKRKNEDLELRARVRQDLTDMIAHDLKAPLTSIKGSLEIVKARGLISDAGYQRLMDNAQSAADFMLLMLNDMLDISQAQSAGLNPQKAEVKAGPLFVKLRALFAGKCEKRELELSCRSAGNAKSLTTDANLLFRILTNLIANAVKVSSRGQSVEVVFEKAGEKSRFSVADRGPGVPQEQKTRIFEKYVALGRKMGFEEGTGIGLSFCRLASEALGGRVWVEDRPGGGSVFFLEL